MESMKFLSLRWIAPALLVALGAAAGSMITYTLSRPQSAMAASTRVYELRTYTTLEGRLPALEKRFREHTMQIFERHGMKNVGYWIPQDEPKHSNTLVYIISHESRDAAKANWTAFVGDPQWLAVSKASEADGKIVQKVESVFLDPTTYSPIQ
jgi:hypothetical protein